MSGWSRFNYNICHLFYTYRVTRNFLAKRKTQDLLEASSGTVKCDTQNFLWDSRQKYRTFPPNAGRQVAHAITVFIYHVNIRNHCKLIDFVFFFFRVFNSLLHSFPTLPIENILFQSAKTKTILPNFLLCYKFPEF